MNLNEQEWRAYLAAYHEDRPAITERLLDRAGESPYEWLARPLGEVPGLILDLACGSAPTRPFLRDARWVGLDSSTGELGYAAAAGRLPLVVGSADALPVATGAASAVCAGLSLQVLTPLETVLGEVRRVLRPGGTLVALVPARPSLRPTGLIRWSRVLRALSVRGPEWPNPEATNGAAPVLRRHGFRIHSSVRRDFLLDISSDDHLDLLIEGLYLPGLPAEWKRAAAVHLRPWIRPGRRLPLPLRRIVAST